MKSIDPILKTTIASLPHKPGVYRYYDQNGLLLYVGKAKDLKKRVSSYFQDSKHINERLVLLVQRIHRIEYSIVSSEKESLILEANLIHSLQPKFNIKLKDDRNYLYIAITNDQIPGIFTTRRKTNPHAKYYGPYTRQYDVNETLRTLRTLFPYCQKKKPDGTPCQYTTIGQCDGICVGKENYDSYKEKIHAIESVLNGSLEPAQKLIKTKIQKAVEHQNYELAGLWKRRIESLEAITESQKIIFSQDISLDIATIVLTTHTSGFLHAAIYFQQIRSGKLVNVYSSMFTGNSQQSVEETAIQVVSQFMLSSYGVKKFEYELYISAWYKDEETVSKVKLSADDVQLLSKEFHIPTFIRYPNSDYSKDIAKLVEMGKANAMQYIDRKKREERLDILDENNLFRTLKEIQNQLKLKQVPRRIECYDISHLSGTDVYGSMVTFIDGKPEKKLYRIFKTKQQNNDFENHKEVLRRRMKRYLELEEKKKTGTEKPSDATWELPDLLVVDGGKGQLSGNVEVLYEFLPKDKVDSIDIVGIAKKEEEIILPNYSQFNHEEVSFGHNGGILLAENTKWLFQRIRDEAHRFAITHNRKARLKKASKSSLDTIQGIGPKTKKKILELFGSTTQLVSETEKNPEYIIDVFGVSIYKKICEHYGIISHV